MLGPSNRGFQVLFEFFTPPDCFARRCRSMAQYPRMILVGRFLSGDAFGRACRYPTGIIRPECMAPTKSIARMIPSSDVGCWQEKR